VEESRRERKKRQTRQLIVATALELFEKQGYEATTVAQIAAAADVDPKTFFNYFPSKEDVLFGDANRDQALLDEAISSRRPRDSPADLLARLFERAVAIQAADPEPPWDRSLVYRLVTTTPDLRAKLLSLTFDLQDQIAEALLEAFPESLTPTTAAAATGAFMGAMQAAVITGLRTGASADELRDAAETGMEIAVRGLREL
jgi:AcrR family transcriptional regulator